MNKEPLVSIIIANFNDDHFLAEAFASIQKQPFSDFQIIVVDDASTDDSIKFLEKASRDDFRISYLQNEKNRGTCQSVNRGILHARGKYIFCIGADDLVLPNFFETMVSELEKHPSIPIAFADFGFFHEGEKEIKTEKLIKNQTFPLVVEREKALRFFQKNKFWIPGSATLLRRKDLLNTTLFVDEIKSHADWLLNHDIALRSGFIYVPKTLTAMRLKKVGFSRSIKNRTALTLTLLSYLKSNSQTNKLFKASGLLYPHIKKSFFSLALRPQFWDYLASMLSTKLRRL